MDKFAERMAELAEKYGPHVVDSVRGAARVDAYSYLAAGGEVIFISLIFAIGGRALWLKHGVAYREHEDETAFIVMAGVCGVLAAILFFCGIWRFIDPWTWTAINNPDLWIAKKVLHL